MYIGRYREILGDTGTGRWEMWADMGRDSRFAEIGEIQGDVRSCAANESIRRLPGSRVIFRGTGWGTGLQQPQTGSTLHPQQSVQLRLFDEGVLIHRA